MSLEDERKQVARELFGNGSSNSNDSSQLEAWDILKDAYKVKGKKTNTTKNTNTGAGTSSPEIKAPPSPNEIKAGLQQAMQIDDADKYHQLALENARKSPYAHYGENIAKGNRNLNANAQNADTTLRYSRLADYMNNIQWMKKPSTATVGMGFKGLKEGEAGEWHNPHQIETEEMRQQAAIRDLSKMQSGKMIDLQDRYNNMDAMYQEAKMMQKLRLEGAITELQYQQWYQIWQEKFYQDTQAPHREAERRRDEHYSRVTIPYQVAKVLDNLWRADPNLYKQAANVYGSLPQSFWQLIEGNMQQKLLLQYADNVQKFGSDFANKKIYDDLKDITGETIGNIASGATKLPDKIKETFEQDKK